VTRKFAPGVADGFRALLAGDASRFFLSNGAQLDLRLLDCATRRSEVQGAELHSRLCEHGFVTAQGSAYMRFRRALDRGNVTEALSAASGAPVCVVGGGARAQPATRRQ
jgi:hypothetical protein